MPDLNNGENRTVNRTADGKPTLLSFALGLKDRSGFGQAGLRRATFHFPLKR